MVCGWQDQIGKQPRQWEVGGQASILPKQDDVPSGKMFGALFSYGKMACTN